jgi:hypothetical protein
MINVDLSKMLHPRFWDLLPAFLPGVYFEASIFLARPEPFQTYAGTAHLDKYSSAVIALIGAFIFGTVFMFWVRLLQSALVSLQKLATYLWAKFTARLMSSLWQARGPQPSWFAAFSRVLTRAHQKNRGEFESKARGAERAWKKAASQLLLKRYGIEPPLMPVDLPYPGEWYVWTGALGTPDPQPVKGLLFLSAMHATGWSGLAAAWCVPLLRSRFYLSPSLFLIGFGLLQDWRISRWWRDPATRWMLSLRGVLADFPPSHSQPGDEKTDQSERGPNTAGG